MTIKELIERKKSLAEQIQELVRTFEEDTDAEVSEINVYRQDRQDYKTHTFVEVRIDI